MYRTCVPVHFIFQDNIYVSQKNPPATAPYLGNSFATKLFIINLKQKHYKNYHYLDSNVTVIYF